MATTAPRLPELPVPGAAVEGLLHRALAATTSGVVIVHFVAPDQPLVYVNRAFEVLSGLPREEVLGRDCRFLQGRGLHPRAGGCLRALDRSRGT